MWTRRILEAITPNWTTNTPKPTHKPTPRERLIKMGRDPETVELPGIFCCAIDFKFMDNPVIIHPIEGYAIDARSRTFDAENNERNPFANGIVKPIDPFHLSNFCEREQKDIKACLTLYNELLLRKIKQLDAKADQQTLLTKTTKKQKKIEAFILTLVNPEVFCYEHFKLTYLRHISTAIRRALLNIRRPQYSYLDNYINDLIPRLEQLKLLEMKLNDLVREKLAKKLHEDLEDYILRLENIHRLKHCIKDYSGPAQLDQVDPESHADIIAKQQEKLKNWKIELKGEYALHIASTKNLIRITHKKRAEKALANRDTLQEEITALNALQDELGDQDKIPFKLDSDEDINDGWEVWPDMIIEEPPTIREIIPAPRPRVGMYPMLVSPLVFYPGTLFNRHFTHSMIAPSFDQNAMICTPSYHTTPADVD